MQKHPAVQQSLQTFPAVILAAGQGLRLREDADGLPKPLIPLLGMTLLERAVRSCQAAGVTECYVIVGYHKERIISYLHTLAQRHSVRLYAVDNPHWQEGNGTSVLAARGYMRGPFLLLMCDHLFDPAILRTLVAAADDASACLLAVDRHPERLFDVAEATKVQLDGGNITAIGKELVPFDAVDTGLFLCYPILFEALEQARAAGDGSLTGGIRRLIGSKQIRGVDIGNHFWFDVDTPLDVQQATRELLARGPELPFRV
jgi:1L-myo-inositol 1-phosphate cytidylyltransferase